jgi:hypothetical protein
VDFHYIQTTRDQEKIKPEDKTNNSARGTIARAHITRGTNKWKGTREEENEDNIIRGLEHCLDQILNDFVIRGACFEASLPRPRAFESMLLDKSLNDMLLCGARFGDVVASAARN